MKQTQQQLLLSSSITANVGIIFEGLCAILTKALYENDTERIKDVKRIIYKHLYKNEGLKKELELYRTIKDAHFTDPTISNSFLKEAVKQACVRSNKQINEAMFELVSDIPEIYQQELLTEARQSSNKEFYNLMSELFMLKRREEKSILEQQQYFKVFEKLIKEQDKRVQELFIIESENKSKRKVPTFVYKKAVEIFNERYLNKLSPAINQLLQEFLYYRNIEKFKSTLNRKLKETIKEAQDIGKKNDISNIKHLVEEMNSCDVKLQKEKFSAFNDPNLISYVKDVAQFIDITEELKKL